MGAIRKTMNAPVRIGQPITRREDQRFLTGRGRYTDNTAPADALAVLFVRSPHAHARVAGIDKLDAQAVPGIVAVYTAEDTVADGLSHLPCISEIKGEITLLIGKAVGGQSMPRGISIRERVEQIMREEKLDEKAALKKVAKERGISKSEAYRELQQRR